MGSTESFDFSAKNSNLHLRPENIFEQTSALAKTPAPDINSKLLEGIFHGGHVRTQAIPAEEQETATAKNAEAKVGKLDDFSISGIKSLPSGSEILAPAPLSAQSQALRHFGTPTDAAPGPEKTITEQTKSWLYSWEASPGTALAAAATAYKTPGPPLVKLGVGAAAGASVYQLQKWAGEDSKGKE